MDTQNWKAIRKDLNKNLIEYIAGNDSKEDILNILEKYGIKPCIVTSSLQDRQSTTIKLWGTGKPRREFLYVDDLADAVVFLINNYNAIDIGEFINIGTGKDLTIRELAELIKEIVGFKSEIEWDLSKPDGSPQKLLDVKKVHNIGWKNYYIIEKGINKIYKWYCKYDK